MLSISSLLRWRTLMLPKLFKTHLIMKRIFQILTFRQFFHYPLLAFPRCRWNASCSNIYKQCCDSSFQILMTWTDILYIDEPFYISVGCRLLLCISISLLKTYNITAISMHASCSNIYKQCCNSFFQIAHVAQEHRNKKL